MESERADALIINGVPWYDDRGMPVNAHGGGILEHESRWYWFGEYKTDDENTFIGFSCYSSADLVSWRFERIALPQQRGGLLGPGRIGERVKVMRSPTTGRFVMFMHADDLGYNDPHTCVATSDTIDGEFEFHGALTYRGEPIRRWDIGTFQDEDGTGYLLVHEGDIYRLSGDYLTADEKVAEGLFAGGESPAMFSRDGNYHLLFSRKTSWERNDNVVLTARSPRGPWTESGTVAPSGTLTHNSQTTSVLRIDRAGTTHHLFMGDRWSFPRQASAATYVWQLISGELGCLLGEYAPVIDAEVLAPADLPEGTEIYGSAHVRGPGDDITVAFQGDGRIVLRGTSDQHSGYACVEVISGDSVVVISQILDWYSLVPDSGIRWISPHLGHGEYTLRISASGDWPIWRDKKGTVFGSDGPSVKIANVCILQDGSLA